MLKEKKCKGTGKAKGCGCGEVIPVVLYGKANIVYGLGKSCRCYNLWLVTTDAGKEVLEKAKIKGSNNVQKEVKAKKRSEKSLNNDWSALLQVEVNKICRTLDIGLTCLARNVRGKMDAGHIFARGGNSNMKFNLHNIHRQSAHSNHFQNDDGQLREGLSNEYGEGYLNFIRELKRTPVPKYSNVEYRDFTNKARVIVRDLKKTDRVYSKSERIEMRNRINLELGIYDSVYCSYDL